MNDWIDSEELHQMVMDLSTGDRKPITDEERAIYAEIVDVAKRGGFLQIPSDLPEPMTPEAYAAALDDKPTKIIEAKGHRNVRFNRFPFDGDMDGMVQDGTPFERQATSLSHLAIGGPRRKRKLVQRMRLRDMPLDFAPKDSAVDPKEADLNKKQ